MNTDTPSAFPQPNVYHKDGQIEVGQDGMSLRDYFAAKAMQGFIIATTDIDGNSAKTFSVIYKAVDERLVTWSYQIADAMLVERAKHAKPTPIPSTIEPRTRMD